MIHIGSWRSRCADRIQRQKQQCYDHMQLLTENTGVNQSTCGGKKRRKKKKKLDSRVVLRPRDSAGAQVPGRLEKKVGSAERFESKELRRLDTNPRPDPSFASVP